MTAMKKLPAIVLASALAFSNANASNDSGPTGAPGMPGRKAGPLNVYYLPDTPAPAKFASF